MFYDKLKEMFQKITLEKNVAAISQYYHHEFLMYSNEKKMNYEAFLKAHENIYENSINYQIAYDEETFLETGNKIAGRMWITTQVDGQAAVKIEVMLIVEYKEEKIYRLWELTYPDWSELPAFSELQ